ncbi:FAD-dependent oxidoreductase [Rhodobacteraceae bacterium 2CG4]|uniref:FAD-dependent oxidoreductase n=1 Tax=Halovulum marinum TaxID=2662447 RepID=A0A6L5YY37_9RHOB|nr:FAD-dependent oxidoreductase [Halovulum marinum]
MVIIGGAAIGAACAWFLTGELGAGARILVVERDPSFAHASTSHTNSCMRQQFSNPVNIRISQFARGYVRDFRAAMGGDPEVPGIAFDPLGYLYLAATEAGAAALRANNAVQRAEGAAAELLEPAALAARLPFLRTDDLRLASLGGPDEGYFDGATMIAWWRRMARARGVETLAAEAVGLALAGGRATGVRLSTGQTVAAGWVVNAAGPRAARVAAWAGFALPVEPRKRTTWVFTTPEPLGAKLPLTVDPSGVHVRQDGAGYMAGSGPAGADAAVEPDDFTEDPDLWQDHVWPILAARISAFARLRVTASWVGHYAWNRLDRNAVIGAVPGCPNLILANGFSGHGLQQAPAMGRGVAELIARGRFRSLDLSELGPARLLTGTPFAERNVI